MLKYSQFFIRSLVANHLAARDLAPDDIVMFSIDNYFTNTKPEAVASLTDKALILEALTLLDRDDRPNWSEQLQKWTEQFNPANRSQEPTENK